MAIAALPFQNSARAAAGSKSSCSAGPSFAAATSSSKCPHERRPGDGRFERFFIEQRRIVVALFGVGRGPGQEHEPRPTAGQRLDRAVLHPDFAPSRGAAGPAPHILSRSAAACDAASPASPPDNSSRTPASPAARRRLRCPRRLPGSAAARRFATTALGVAGDASRHGGQAFRFGQGAQQIRGADHGIAGRVRRLRFASRWFRRLRFPSRFGRSIRRFNPRTAVAIAGSSTTTSRNFTPTSGLPELPCGAESLGPHPANRRKRRRTVESSCGSKASCRLYSAKGASEQLPASSGSSSFRICAKLLSRRRASNELENGKCGGIGNMRSFLRTCLPCPLGSRFVLEHRIHSTSLFSPCTPFPSFSREAKIILSWTFPTVSPRNREPPR